MSNGLKKLKSKFETKITEMNNIVETNLNSKKFKLTVNESNIKI